MPPRYEWSETDAELLGLLKSLGSYVGIAAARGVSEHAVRGEFRRRNLNGQAAAHRKPRQTIHDGPSSAIAEQEIPVIVRDYRHLDRLRLYPLGDVHLGAVQHKSQRWQEWLDYLVQNDDTSLLCTGDMFNSAIIGSKSDVYDETMTVGEAQRVLMKQLAPLAEADRLDLLQPGNHENRVTRAVGICPIRTIADFLGVPYSPAMAMMVYLVGGCEYHILTRHGTGSGQSLVQLAKGGRVAVADVYVTGHVHRMGHTVDHIFVMQKRRLVRHEMHFVSSGAFLGLELYAQERGYPPSKIGAPRISLSGRVKDVKVSM